MRGEYTMSACRFARRDRVEQRLGIYHDSGRTQGPKAPNRPVTSGSKGMPPGESGMRTGRAKIDISTVLNDLLTQVGRCVTLDHSTQAVVLRDQAALRARGIDVLVNAAVFGTQHERAAARWLIWELGQVLGIRPASIHELYMARGRGALPPTFTTPAMNIRIMSYDSMRAAIASVLKANVGAFIFEIARGEMIYSDQRPAEFTAVAVAAAIKEGFRGPLFIQGDHFQINAEKFEHAPDAEVASLHRLINESLDAGFYNIDIDTSTLVDLTKPVLDDQQHANYDLCQAFSDYIRARQPAGVTVSLGGEIGEVGHRNSTVAELRTFMNGYETHITRKPGLSKISIQTGTSHGGTVLPDGSIAGVNIDFECLRELSEAARDYGMGGAVQHGASTLPESVFDKFVQAGAIEVHLATALMQVVFDSMPKALNVDITDWLFSHALSERKAGDTDEQFLHKTRKKATGAFKRALWTMGEAERQKVREALMTRFDMLFTHLGVNNTRGCVESTVHVPEIHKRLEDFAIQRFETDDTRAFAD